MDRLAPFLIALVGATSVHADELKTVIYSPGVNITLRDTLFIEPTFIEEKIMDTSSGPVTIVTRQNAEIKPVRCGLRVDWGDGSKTEARLGKDLKPPFRFSHAYKSEGRYTVKIKGTSLGSGFSSVPACKADDSRSVHVVDSARIAREKAADERRAEEQKREAQRLAEAQRQKEQQQLQAASKAAKEREAALALTREQESQAEKERQAAIAREQERKRQEEAARKTELALSQQRKKAEYEAELKRLTGGSEPIVWAETASITPQGLDPAPPLLEDVNSRLWEMTDRSIMAAQKPRPVIPTYDPPALRKKGEFEKTADYEAFVQNENAKHTAAFNARLAAYEQELAAFEKGLAGQNERKGEIYAQHAKQYLPVWLGAMDKTMRYDADKEHYVLSIASHQYAEYQITGVLPIPIAEAKAKNDRIRSALVTVVLSIDDGSLDAKGIIVSTESESFSGSAASTVKPKMTEMAARAREQKLVAAAEAAEKSRIQAEKARREEAQRIAAAEAKRMAEAEKAARQEAERLAKIEAKKQEEAQKAAQEEAKRLAAVEEKERQQASLDAAKKQQNQKGGGFSTPEQPKNQGVTFNYKDVECWLIPFLVQLNACKGPSKEEIMLEMEGNYVTLVGAYLYAKDTSSDRAWYLIMGDNEARVLCEQTSKTAKEVVARFKNVMSNATVSGTYSRLSNNKLYLTNCTVR